MSEFVRLEVEGGIGTIRLDRPKMNALNTEIQEALFEVSADAPGVTAPLLGARTAAQLEVYLGLDADELPAEIVSARNSSASWCNSRSVRPLRSEGRLMRSRSGVLGRSGTLPSFGQLSRAIVKRAAAIKFPAA